MYRGQVEYLVRLAGEQFRQIRELLARLRALGEDTSRFERGAGEDAEAEKYRAWTVMVASGDAKPWERDERLPIPGGPPPPPSAGDLQPDDAKSADPSHATTTESLYLRLPVDVPNDSANGTLSLPDVRTGIAHRRYMGVAHGGGSSRSSNPGFRLNMLGWELDLASFTGGTDDEFEPLPSFERPLYDRSFRSFIATAHGLQPKLQRPVVPARDQAFHYATIFLHGHNAFMPILHGPTLINLVRFLTPPVYAVFGS